MRCSNAIALVMVVSLVAIRSECASVRGSDSPEVACQDAVLAQAWKLLASAQYGRAKRESAAFIVRDTRGHYAFQLWPFDVKHLQASFRGTRPPGTVAVIHTHPNESELPSENDRLESVATGLPIYVVTRWRISKADQGHVETVWHGNWHDDSGNQRASAQCMPVAEHQLSSNAAAGRR